MLNLFKKLINCFSTEYCTRCWRRLEPIGKHGFYDEDVYGCKNCIKSEKRVKSTKKTTPLLKK